MIDNTKYKRYKTVHTSHSVSDSEEQDYRATWRQRQWGIHSNRGKTVVIGTKLAVVLWGWGQKQR